MKRLSVKDRLFLIFCLVVVLAAACVVLFRPRPSTETPSVEPLPVKPLSELSPRVVIKEKVIETEKSVSIETVSADLHDMGFLVTADYYFTELVSYSSIGKLFGTELKLPFTESNYIAAYDGRVEAGIDFSLAKLTKDEVTGNISISLPKPAIHSVDIGPESFKLYSEKSGLFNPISVTDFNASLTELESTAREKAMQSGLLSRAEQNAEKLVESFIMGMGGDTKYTIIFNS